MLMKRVNIEKMIIYFWTVDRQEKNCLVGLHNSQRQQSSFIKHFMQWSTEAYDVYLCVKNGITRAWNRNVLYLACNFHGLKILIVLFLLLKMHWIYGIEKKTDFKAFFGKELYQHVWEQNQLILDFYLWYLHCVKHVLPIFNFVNFLYSSTSTVIALPVSNFDVKPLFVFILQMQSSWVSKFFDYIEFWLVLQFLLYSLCSILSE